MIVHRTGWCSNNTLDLYLGGSHFESLSVQANSGAVTHLGHYRLLSSRLGRAIAQAVSRRLPTAAAQLRARVWSCGICGGQSGAGAEFLRVLRFPLQFFILPIAPQSPSSIIWGWYSRPVVAAVPSGLGLTPLRIIIIIIINQLVAVLLFFSHPNIRCYILGDIK
jgi:hypothetical protein